MQFTEVVRGRRMVRRFDPTRAVPERVLFTILDNATRAPSAGFSQGWDFVVLNTPQDRETFWAATVDPATQPDSWLRGVRTAPTLILCCSDPGAYLRRYAEADKATSPRGGPADDAGERWPVPYWDVDTGMASLLMLLTAVEHGLGSLFFAVPPERCADVRSALGVPADRRLVGVVAVGYPAPGRRSRSRRRPRRGVQEVAHRGTFGVPWQPRASSSG